MSEASQFLLDSESTAVLVVDVQPFFADQELEPPVGEVLHRLRCFLDAAREAGVLRVFIRAEFPSESWTSVWEEQFGEELGVLLAPGSSSVEFQSGFEPEPGDLVVVKDCYSSFRRTNLERLLRCRGIETVVVAGLTTDVCVSSTASDAFQLDFRTITLSDCCAEQMLARHECGLETLGSTFGRVCESTEVLAALRVGIPYALERLVSSDGCSGGVSLRGQPRIRQASLRQPFVRCNA